MIIYFANRQMEILGQASTNLPKGILIKEDKKTEEIETGVATFDCRIPFTKASRKKAEQMAEVGNYILRSDGDENEFYTIIDAEIDTENRDIYVYAEDAGLDLLNEIVLEYSSDEKHTLKYYVEKWTVDSGFEIGIDESTDEEEKLPSMSESTVTERLNHVAEQFGYEISFGFAIERMVVTHKYINIYKKRGKDAGTQLRLNKDIDRIITKKSIANLATALLCTGANIDGTDFKTTLDGYQYDDGDFYVDGHYLKSRKAVAEWGRYAWKNEPNKLNGYEGHIVKTFDCDTVDQEELCKQAIAELKKICDIECNYEVDLRRLPSNVKIGDTVYIIDDEGELYLSARILKLEKSICENTKTATLGEYLIKESGVSQKVEELAAQFSQIAKSRTLYTWIVYADDKYGAGIALDPENKVYMGIATNRLEAEANISDPGVFTWSKVTGDPGETGRSPEMIENQYYLSTSSTRAINGEWSLEIPSWESGKYIWKRSVITWSDKTVTYTEPVLDSAINHANEASEYAKQQADTAKEAAVNAESAAISSENNAVIASNASIAAQNTANDASMTAATAQDIANAAQKSADEANAEVVLINKEVSNIKADATLLRDDLEEQITTVKNTMEISYAKKTEVSETEMTLKEEISKSAAEIQSIMSTDYAKKTDLTEVQSNLQTQVTQNAANITSTASAVEEVKIDASNAQKKAEEANVAANSAVSKADNAVKAASDAQSAADTANLAAQNAKEEATKAQTAANTAKVAAENAQIVADAAQVDLDEAKANLESVTNRVGATEEDIAVAQEAVDAAQKAADKANEDAINAKSAASKAQDTADKAQENAVIAQNAANIADANATTAKTAADNAQKSADEANKAVGNLANTVTVMNTKIDQNAEAIELAATKEDVANYLSGYSTKSEMNSAINQRADSILTTVEGIYTTKADFDNLEIGGNNLLMYTAYDNLNGVNNRGSYHTVSMDTSNKRNGRNSLKIVCKTVSVSGSQDVWQKLWSNLTVGDNLMLSFWVKGSVASKMWCRVGGGSTVNNATNVSNKNAVTITTEWKKVTIDLGECTGAGSAGAVEIIYGFGTVGTFWINSMKLEKGNKATDWSPAPEDLDEQIDSVKASLEMKVNKDTLISEINASADVITLTGNRFIVNSDNFKLTADGTMTANNGIFGGTLNGATGSFSGSITANRGAIGDLTLSNGILTGTGTLKVDDETSLKYTTTISKQGVQINSYDINNTSDKYEAFVQPDHIKFSAPDVETGLGANGLVCEYTDSAGIYNSSKIMSNYIQLAYLSRTEESLYLNCSAGGVVIDALDSVLEFGTEGLMRFNVGDGTDYISMTVTPNSLDMNFGCNNNGNYISYNGYNTITSSFYTVIDQSAKITKNLTISGDYGLTFDGSGDVRCNGEHGLYSATMGKYIVRYYVANTTKCTALGNNSYATRIYGSEVWANKAVSTSDERLKTDFNSLDDILDVFMELEPVSFKWKQDYEDGDNLIHFGLKAQQVEKTFKKYGYNTDKYSVIGNFGGYMGICYDDLFMMTMCATQKNTKELMYQAGKIDLHETIIQDLQNRIYELETQLKELRQAAA